MGWFQRDITCISVVNVTNQSTPKLVLDSQPTPPRQIAHAILTCQHVCTLMVVQTTGVVRCPRADSRYIEHRSDSSPIRAQPPRQPARAPNNRQEKVMKKAHAK